MPRIRLTLPGQGIPWTKTPNQLLDRMLPELKDTELRVLLVVLRLTTGMNREGRPVVIPYRTLKRLTGRQSEAIAGALRSLANSGLIHITGFRRATRAEEAKRTGQQTEQQQ